MFLTVLGGSLVLGAGLLAAAGYSEGALVAARTAALTIGWLLLFVALIGVQGARRRRLAELGTTTLVFFSGAAVLYLSYFHWGEIVAAEVLAELEPDINLIAEEPLAASAALVSTPAVARVAVPAAVKKPPSPGKELADPCSSLGGLEALQCRRCGGKRGLSWAACQESARLEYCEGRPADEAACPSPIPAAYPG
jgi:hypothetical protein